MKPLVYIAGPYTHPDPVLNVREAVSWGESVEAHGCTVFIPHLSMLWHLVAPAGIDQWYARDLEVLEHCDALVRFPGLSVGADREVERARALGLPVFDLDERGIDFTWEQFRGWISKRTRAAS